MSDSCAVCGCTDSYLVDGYYYCVECGTQDTNVREKLVEHTALADGTFGFATKRKIHRFVEKIEMSGEWYKWHTYNFILLGLTDELINYGAKPSIKPKILWIWTKYIKKYQVKDKSDVTDAESTLNESKLENSKNHNIEESDNSDKEQEKNKTKRVDVRKDIRFVSKGLFLAILYLGLNLDKSDIQLMTLFRLIRESKLSLMDCIKFVPKELHPKFKLIPHWKNFENCHIIHKPFTIRTLAINLLKELDLGLPLVPNLKSLVSIYLQELCLPCDFKDLVFALMHLFKCDFLELDSKTKSQVVRMPDYEPVCMAYILVAMKMCFGLDDDYEKRLSDAVEKINEEENHLKSYKLVSCSEPTDRLFSFRDWYKYLLMRKIILSKNYLPAANKFNQRIDDFVFMEHLEEHRTRKMNVEDDVIMNILNKMKLEEVAPVIPKSEFTNTLTPLSTYASLVAEYIHDSETKLLLCEDFTQYSLKYATRLNTLPGGDDLVEGVSKERKIYLPMLIETFRLRELDFKCRTRKDDMVFIRNCENKNWLKTNPPNLEHITKAHDEMNTRDSDHGYDSNESTHVRDDYCETIVKKNWENYQKYDCIPEDTDANIFDDVFDDSKLMEQSNIEIDNAGKFINNENIDDFPDSKMDNIQSDVDTDLTFNPDSFDRDKTIEELIEIACKKYKISLPKTNYSRGPRRRKSKFTNDETGESGTKKRKLNCPTKYAENKGAVKRMIAAYYETMENDVLHTISEQVKSVISTIDITQILNTNDSIPEPENVSAHGVSEVIEPFENVDNLDQTDMNESVEENYMECSKGNPKFDDKTHDAKQLYVKVFNDEISVEDIFNLDEDAEINDLISKKIDERTSKRYKENEESSDSDADTPLSILQEQKILEMERKKEKYQLPKLVKATNVRQFKYWFRHYLVFKKELNQRFNRELKETCPKSFVFVIEECAAISYCTTFSLYTSMQKIEELMIAKCLKK